VAGGPGSPKDSELVLASLVPQSRVPWRARQPGNLESGLWFGLRRWLRPRESKARFSRRFTAR